MRPRNDEKGKKERLPAGGARGLVVWAALTLTSILMLGAAARWGEARAVVDPKIFAAADGPRSGDLPTLLFVFQARDCPSNRALVELWTSLDSRGEVRGLAVGLDFPKDTTTARRLAVDAGLALSFRPDLGRPAERLILGLGFRRTPVTLLLDPTGRVRLALPAPEGPEAFREAEQAVLAHVELLRREAWVAPP